MIADKISRTSSFRLMTAAALLIVIVVVRLPFIANILGGEEGEFALLVLSDAPISSLSAHHLPREVVGFIDKKPILISFHRTVMPYIILERLGRLFAPRHALGHLPLEELTIAARLPFAIIFLIGSVGLIVLAVQAASPTGTRVAFTTATTPLAMTLWSLTTPLAVGASIEPQIDGSVGILLLGTAATLLAVGQIDQGGARWRFLGAGILAGLGKHEWALALAGAALGTASICFVASCARRSTMAVLAAFFAGLILAVGLSYAVSPQDYRDGFHVMASFYAETGGQLWALQTSQWPFTLPVLALLAVDGIFLALVLRPLLRTAPGLCLAFLGATAIVAGYTASGWPGDFFPRYFAPPLVILAIVFVSLWLRFKDANAPALRWAVVAIPLAGLGANAAFLAASYASQVSITSWRGTALAKLAQDYATAASLARDTHGIVFAFAPAWIYAPEIDYISAGLGRTEAIKLVAASDPGAESLIVFPPDDMVYPPAPQ